jgi:hypothetical protein
VDGENENQLIDDFHNDPKKPDVVKDPYNQCLNHDHNGERNTAGIVYVLVYTPQVVPQPNDQ